MKILAFLILFCAFNLNAQIQIDPSVNGIYHLYSPEKGPSGKTYKMILEFIERNTQQMLAIAPCAECYPAIYSYKPELTRKFGKPIFYNSSRIHVLQYDDESFIICMVAVSLEKDFEYINFYSKSKSKVNAMSLEKIQNYANNILNFL